MRAYLKIEGERVKKRKMSLNISIDLIDSVPKIFGQSMSLVTNRALEVYTENYQGMSDKDKIRELTILGEK